MQDVSHQESRLSFKPFNVFLRRYNSHYSFPTHTQTCTHTYTTPGNLYLSHSISNLRKAEQNCFFFLSFFLSSLSPQLRRRYFNSGCRVHKIHAGSPLFASTIIIIVLLFIAGFRPPDGKGQGALIAMLLA